MSRRWCPVLIVASLVFELMGCATIQWPEHSKVDARVGRTAINLPEAVRPNHGTALATENGHVLFFDDIFAHDRRLQQALDSRHAANH